MLRSFPIALLSALYVLCMLSLAYMPLDHSETVNRPGQVALVK